MKNSADLGGCYPPRPSASVDNVDNTLLDMQSSSYPTQPHSIIAKYSYLIKLGLCEDRFPINAQMSECAIERNKICED